MIVVDSNKLKIFVNIVNDKKSFHDRNLSQLSHESLFFGRTELAICYAIFISTVSKDVILMIINCDENLHNELDKNFSFWKL